MSSLLKNNISENFQNSKIDNKNLNLIDSESDSSTLSSEDECSLVQKSNTNSIENVNNIIIKNLNLNYTSIKENFPGNYDNYIKNSLYDIYLIKNKINFEKYYSNKINLNINNNKQILFIDLDETLIHSDIYDKKSFIINNYDKILKFKYDNLYYYIGINFRKNLNFFLKKVSKYFNLILFTASYKEYADVIIDYIDPENNIFKKRFYKESCINLYENINIKDLNIFNDIDLKCSIILDNNIFSFCNNLNNGILINSFFEGEDDDLINIYYYLDNYIKNSEDVRKVNENLFGFEKFLNSFS